MFKDLRRNVSMTLNVYYCVLQEGMSDDVKCVLWKKSKADVRCVSWKKCKDDSIYVLLEE